MSAQEEAAMKTLHDASVRGCVSTLNTLIQQDPLILNKISLTTCTETPLHVSALLGHLDFSKTLLTHKPQLARELDSCRRTALHLASAEGHKDIVHVLLQAYADACLVHDEDGRIPVEYGAMRGRAEVVRELIKAKPDSLRLPGRLNTVMHLCVTYNHLETLKVVVEEEGDTSEQLLNFGDFDGGNTILHLATMLKQVEIVRYLLSIPKIRETANSKNEMGFTALDVIEHTPKDLKSLEIQLMLTDIGIKSKKSIQEVNNHNPLPLKEDYWIKFKKWMGNLFQRKPDRMERSRETLGLVATVISTMSFQAALNPPGGVYQEINKNLDDKEYYPCIKYTDNHADHPTDYNICPGDALSGIPYSKRYYYKIFLIFNTISFVASTTVSILLVSGVPIQNRVVMWFLTIGMCITVVTVNATYLLGVLLTVPDTVGDSNQIDDFFYYLIWFFIVEFFLIALVYIIRLLAWLVWECIKGVKRARSRRTQSNTLISIISST